MEGPFWSVALYGGFAGLATLAGIYIVLTREAWARRGSIYLISFASGALLAASLLDILPESLELNENAIVYVLLSFLAFYILEQNVVVHAGHEDPEGCSEESEMHRRHTLGVVSFLGIGFHSLLDGVIIGAGFADSAVTGFIATVGVILHEFPEGLSMMAILLHAGLTRTKALAYSVVVALATPVGAIVSYLALQGIRADILGGLLGIAAGSFLYIAASDLIPETRRQSSPYNIPLVIGGMAILFVLKLVL
jgi:zinc and cadmium transporter